MGYKFIGDGQTIAVGRDLQTVGDIDGDGRADFLVSAPGDEGLTNGLSNGSVFLVHGADLASLDAADGTEDGTIHRDTLKQTGVSGTYEIIGSDPFASLGVDIGNAGDVDGDGLSDLLLGATSGRTVAVPELHLISAADLETLDLADGTLDRKFEVDMISTTATGNSFQFVTDSMNARLKTAHMGQDFDGDGRPDIFFANERYVDPVSGGQPGKAMLVSSADLGALDAEDGVVDGRIDVASVSASSSATSFSFLGEGDGDLLGYDLDFLGDFDGDGNSEIMLTARAAERPFTSVASGAAYILKSTDLATLDAADGATDGEISLSQVLANTTDDSFRIHGTMPGEQLGVRIANAGDVNGDGTDEILLASESDANGQIDAGKIHLIDPNDLAAIDAADGTVDGSISHDMIAGTGASYTISGKSDADGVLMDIVSAGDVDGDGKADLLIGQPFGSDSPPQFSSGTTYLIKGADLDTLDAVDGNVDGEINLGSVATSSLDTSYVIQGSQLGDFTGMNLSSAGDIDWDGKDDILIGAPDANVNSINDGRAYLLEADQLEEYDAADGTLDGIINLDQVQPILPFLTSFPDQITLDENTTSHVDLSGLSIDHIGGSTLILTLSTDDGDLNAIGDGSMIGAGVAINQVIDHAIQLVGAPEDINAYLQVPGSIEFTPPPTGSITDALSVLVSDPNSGKVATLPDIKVDFVPIPDDPEGDGFPSVFQVEEDVTTDLALPGVEITDIDSAVITVFIEAENGTLEPPVPSTTVTATLVDDQTVSIDGAPGDIETYLRAPGSVKYTPAPDANGVAQDVLTVSSEDEQGTGLVEFASINVDIDPVNDAPTGTGLPGEVTVLENQTGNIDLSDLVITDTDGTRKGVTVRLSVDAGTFEAPGDIAAASLSAMATLVDAQTIDISGPIGLVVQYFDDPANIRYTPPTDQFGDDVATISVTADDGEDSTDVGTVDVNVTEVAPVPPTPTSPAPSTPKPPAPSTPNPAPTMPTAPTPTAPAPSDPAPMPSTPAPAPSTPAPMPSTPAPTAPAPTAPAPSDPAPAPTAPTAPTPTGGGGTSNSAPNGITLSNNRIVENVDAGTLVGTVNATDPDPGDSHSFTLLDDANGAFVLSGTELKVAPDALLDHEASESQTVTVRATDQDGQSYDQTLTIDIENQSEIFVGTDDSEQIMTGVGGGTITLGGGQDSLLGSASDLFDDIVTDFGLQDTLIFEGEDIARDAITVAPGTANLQIDTDGDGASNGQIMLQGDFSGGDFMAVKKGADTHVSFETFLPDMGEQQTVESTQVNGINNQDFLTGDGETGFEVSLKGDMMMAGQANALGLYEVDSEGNIVDVRMLVADAKSTPNESVQVTDVDAGNALGFFLVADGADWANGLSASDTLEFSDTKNGGAATVNSGADINLTANGVEAGLTVFHSFSERLNTDGTDHVLSGVEPGGTSITIGFEDMIGGDNDFQDLVIGVSTFDLV